MAFSKIATKADTTEGLSTVTKQSAALSSALITLAAASLILSLLEAIATGAFPIQTDTSCANEWIINGRTGFIVKSDVLQVSDSIGTALDDDELVDRAQIINQQTSKERLGDLAISAKALSFYKV